MATTCTAPGHCALTRCEHGTFRDPISESLAERSAGSDRRAIDIRAANDDCASLGDPATVCDPETLGITNTRTDRGGFDDTGADVRSLGSGRDLEHICRGGTRYRKWIEDGEPVDSHVVIDRRRRPDTAAFSKPDRRYPSVELRDAIAVDIHDATTVTDSFTDSKRIPNRGTHSERNTNTE